MENSHEGRNSWCLSAFTCWKLLLIFITSLWYSAFHQNHLVLVFQLVWKHWNKCLDIDIGVINVEFITLQYVLELKYLTTMSRNWSDLQPELSSEISSTIQELGFQFMTPVQVSKCESKFCSWKYLAFWILSVFWIISILFMSFVLGFCDSIVHAT